MIEFIKKHLKGREKMDIRHGVNRFYIGDDEKAPLAEMTYVDSGEHLVIIDHTEAVKS